MFGTNNYRAKHRNSLYSGTAQMPDLTFARAPKNRPLVNINGLQVGDTELARPLASSERGAIIAPPNRFDSGANGNVSIGTVGFDPDIVRAALLFFDRLDYPRNSLLQVGEECPEGLEGWEGFQRSRLHVSGRVTAEFMSTVAGEIFEQLNLREEGMWAVARGTTQQLIPEAKLNPLSGFKMRLENALPIPDRSVSYDEVLSFKSRHGDELAALRSYIDDMAIDVSRNGFSKFEQSVAFEKFDKALADYHKVTRQANFLKRLTSVDISFSITDAVKNILSNASMASLAIPSLESAAIGAVMGLGVSVGLKEKADRNAPSPFEYVFRAGNEM